jgi:hypothetical protein
VKDFKFFNLPPTGGDPYAYFDIIIRNSGTVSVTLPVGMETAIYKNILTISNKIGAVTLGKPFTLVPGQDYAFPRVTTKQDAYLKDVVNVSVRVDESKMVNEANEGNNVLGKKVVGCIDSDGGDNSYVKGTTIFTSTYEEQLSLTDKCEISPDGTTRMLKEFSCSKNSVYAGQTFIIKAGGIDVEVRYDKYDESSMTVYFTSGSQIMVSYNPDYTFDLILKGESLPFKLVTAGTDVSASRIESLKRPIIKATTYVCAYGCSDGTCKSSIYTCAGTCKSTYCSSYTDCTMASGTCSSGYCCTGTCI